MINHKRIIVRFEKEDDLLLLCRNNNIKGLNNLTKEYNFITKEIKYKKRDIKGKQQKKEYWQEHWNDMPEYISNKQEPFAKIEFIFEDNEVFIENASKVFNQNITNKTKSIWFPKLIAGKNSKIRVIKGDKKNKYPIYVVSKGRHDKCYTSNFLSQMETEHFVIVEPSDYDNYKNSLEGNYCKVLIMDMEYKEAYDTFDNLGNSKSKGPGAVRNFCWEHSILNGHDWHWVMDDNANEGFHYMNHNRKQKCRTGTIFRVIEDFVDRYENIGIAGLNYSKFCKESDKTPAFVMNTRIYSFLLINNNIKYRWRGRYNEDTDLSLRVLKDGLCTVQFNCFLAGKATTQKIQGGNTEEFYSKEGTYPKSKMIEDMHPDLAKVVWKFNRWHHYVDYSGFKQKLKLKKDLNIKEGINNYGMVVINTEEENTLDTKSYLEKKYNYLL